MKKFLKLTLAFLLVFIGACQQESEESTLPDDVNSFIGVWVRFPGPSGDRTDLAIGNIAGQAENRVYMCEKKGSTAAGLYKGTISGNTIIWDSQYNVPNTVLRFINSSEIEFSYPSVSNSIPTRYSRGSWSGDCTSITSGGIGTGTGTSGTGIATFWTQSDIGCGPITVTINGVSRTINSFFSNGLTTCVATGSANFTLSVGNYSYTASCTGRAWSGTVAVTTNGCSLVQLTSSNGTATGGGTGTTTGTATFWTQSDLGCGPITVTINGVSRTINSFFSGGAPSCGAFGTAGFTLYPGSYSYTASCTSRTWSGTISVTSNGCSLMQLTTSNGTATGGGTGTTTGTATFWTQSDLGCGPITVTVNGVARTINSFFSGGAPSCGTSGTASYTLNPGTYTYTASCTGRSWSGTISVTSNGCSRMQLTTSNGTSTGGGGTGTTTGSVTFWTRSDLGCGPITVTINGVSRTINSFFSNGLTTCGASGSANFTLNSGNYNYSASCSGKTWNGTVSVTSNGCSLRQLVN